MCRSNGPLDPTRAGNPALSDPNRWQPLRLDVFVDQSGNATDVPLFLGAEWGEVLPFALAPDDASEVERDGEPRTVYLDPGPPALLGDDPAANAGYLDGHALVALWSAHLDPDDGVTWDVSPASIGKRWRPARRRRRSRRLPRAARRRRERRARAPREPRHRRALRAEPGAARRLHARARRVLGRRPPTARRRPVTGSGSTTRRWPITPAVERRLAGEGAVLDALEFDVKSYLVLGGAMHDSAIAAWSAKGALRLRASDLGDPLHGGPGSELGPDGAGLLGAGRAARARAHRARRRGRTARRQRRRERRQGQGARLARPGLHPRSVHRHRRRPAGS